jgi:hypothetical protein
VDAAHSKSLSWPQLVGVGAIIAAIVGIGHAYRLSRGGSGPAEGVNGRQDVADPQ